MDMVDRLVAAQRPVLAANFEEELQLFPGGDLRRAEKAGYGEGAAGIGQGRRGRMVLAPEPAAQEARHEAVAGAQHIIDLDRKALADNAVLDARWNGVGKDDAAHGASLQDDGSFGDGADLAQSGERVLLAAGNMHFFFRADDEI